MLHERQYPYEHAPEGGVMVEPQKILIVDDSKFNIEILVQALRDQYKLGARRLLMSAATYREIRGLFRMTVGELREKHLEVFGEETRSRHISCRSTLLGA